MSTPRTLALPDGVQATIIDSDRGPFAAQVVRGGTSGHVLLIPGWTGSKEDFTPLLPLLAAAGYEATAFDQRGQYETPGADDADYSLAGFAADAVAIARAVSAEATHLLGHSFGGLVAQQAVVDSAPTWASLSLLCTGPGTLGQSPQRPLDKLIAALESPTPMAEIVQALKGDLDDEPADIEEFVLEKFQRTSRVSLAAMTRHLLDSPDQTEQIAATGVRCWVGRGADDNAWPHDQQDEQARRLGTRTVVVPDAAHSPAIENPEGMAGLWLAFLAG